LSEEANVEYLQEKIKVAKRKQRSADAIIGFGMFSIALDLILSFLRPDLVDISYRVLLVILGAILVVGGTIIYENARRQYYGFLGQLKDSRRRVEEQGEPKQPVASSSLALAQTLTSFQTRIMKLKGEKVDLKVEIEKFRKIAEEKIRVKEEETVALEEEMVKLKKELESLKESIGSLE